MTVADSTWQAEPLSGLRGQGTEHLCWKKRLCHFLAVVLSWLIAAPLFAQTTAPLVFRAGAATSNITPPLGSPIVGGFAPFPATHVHDELHARCLVLDDGTIKFVFVVCDLLGSDRRVSDEARVLLKQDLGIPPDNVLKMLAALLEMVAEMPPSCPGK